MLRVGLTGGVASGKSTLGRLLERLGAARCDADSVVAQLYRPGRPGAAAVAELFGGRALTSEGGVDHAALAGLVLAEPAARRRLEAAVHPLVRKAIEGWFAALGLGGAPPAVAVVEAALLVETGAYRDHPRLVVVVAPAASRRAWALAAGWPEERFARVVAAQLDDQDRLAAADYVVPNDGDQEALAGRARELWACLEEDAAALAAGRPLAERRSR